GVEAFCTFDTGHDLSPRFWGVADRCAGGDAARYDDTDPLLPLVAPDLTANVACQRTYLALIAEALGEDAAPWRDAARASEAALWRECFDEDDDFFYDREATGSHRRLQSDVLLRVLACEVGDGALFARALERYLMNRTKFLAGYGLTSIALDDPRFDRDFSRNSWGGPTNALTMLRTPQAFERHGRVAELATLSSPMIEALAAADRFPQCFDPWSGAAGFTEVYSPAILWFLDAIERHCGILPRPDGELWLSALSPTRIGHGTAADAVAYARTHAGVAYELACDDEAARVWRDGHLWLTFPRGWRVIVDAGGEVQAVVGLSPAAVSGDLTIGELTLPLTLAGNDHASVSAGTLGNRTSIGVVTPRS
ncbi:MAG: MGH1-like glycoside hydrolase domain-containing protein, partial [Demequina sp.]